MVCRRNRAFRRQQHFRIFHSEPDDWKYRAGEQRQLQRGRDRRLRFFRRGHQPDCRDDGLRPDAGATASSSCSGSLTVTTSASVNTSVLGTYTISYVATGPTSLSTISTRVVYVQDTIAPVITPATVNGQIQVTNDCSVSTYVDPGATASDNCGTSLTVTTISGGVTSGTLGSYLSLIHISEPTRQAEI